MARKLILDYTNSRSGEDTYDLLVDTEDGPHVLRLVVGTGTVVVKAAGSELKLSLPEPDDEFADTVYDRALGALPATVDLYETNQWDELPAEWIQKAFAGEDLYDDLHGDLSFLEQRTDNMWGYLERYVDEDDLALLRQTKDKIEELMLAMSERDESDAVADIATSTGSRYVRYRLDHEVDLSNDSDEALAAQVNAIADVLGLDGSDAASVIEQVLINAGMPDWSLKGLWLFWYGNVAQLIEACQAEDNEGNPLPQTVTLRNPEIMVLGSADGTGWSERIEATITVPFDRSRLKLDAAGLGNGLSWSEEIADIGGSTNTTVTFNPID